MDPDRPDIASLLQQHGRSLRRLAFELLRDPAAADDAVQETWLRTVQHPPQRAAQAHGWLATVLRHVVFRSHRGERRRAARERLVAEEPLAEDPAAVVARSELAERVLRAVRSLDEPYRATIWQRFFEDLPPNAIAARAGVPVATVKSRLQRGLQQLRERLGEGGESSDWRGALALAFGFDLSTPAATAGTVVAAGGVTMAMWTKVAALTAVVGMLAVWWWPRSPANVSPPVHKSNVAAVLQSERLGEAGTASNNASLASDRESVGVSETFGDSSATLVGRCVDATGLPIAGCRVRLRAWQRNQEAMDDWLRDHEAPVWDDQTQTTSDDGRFAFRFVPIPPHQFLVSVDCDELVCVQTRWLRIAAGARIDVRDVVLRAGVRLTGLLVDEGGKPQPNADLNTTPRDSVWSNDGVFAPWDGLPAKTDAAGRFRWKALHLPGTYHVSHRQGDSYGRISTIELNGEQAVVDVTLVTRAQPAKLTIAGHVLDNHGQPLNNALVRSTTEPLVRPDWTDRHGAFVLEPVGDSSIPLHIEAELAGYETMQTETPVTWGDKDVAIVLSPAPSLTIRTTDATGSSVENYSVRVLPRNRDRSTNRDYEVRARGPFADGVATVPGVARGTWTVMLEYPSDSGLLTSFVPIEMTGTPLRIDVHAERPTARRLRVVDANGDAVVGSRVLVCDPFEGSFDETTMVSTREELFRRTGKRALVCAETVTDSEGRCAMQGPPGQGVGIELLGPGHIPQRVDAVRLGQPEELVLQVRRGGRIEGRIGPATALDELRRLRGEPSSSTATRGFGSLSLHRDANGRAEWLRDEPDRARFAIDDSGHFELTGVPPGTWQVDVLAWRAEGKTRSTQLRLPGATVTLFDGQTVNVDLDLSAILPGTLEATVRHNGEPLSNATVTLNGSFGVDDRGQRREDSVTVQTDAEGRLTYVGRPGEYGLFLLTADGTYHTRLSASTKVTVWRDRTTSHTFAIWSGEVRITVRTAKGQPAASVRTFVDSGDGGVQVLPPADRDGVVTARLPAGAFRLHPLQNGMPARAVTLATGVTTPERKLEVEATLPPDWND